jgi:peptidoglycan hydrolase FlgJ
VRASFPAPQRPSQTETTTVAAPERSVTAIPLGDARKASGIAIKRTAATPLPIAKARSGAGVTPDEQASKRNDKLRAACNGFEAVFLTQLLGAADTEQGQGILGGDVADSVLKSQFNGTLAETMAKRGALGIGAMLYRQLSKTGEPTK